MPTRRSRCKRIDGEVGTESDLGKLGGISEKVAMRVKSNNDLSSSGDSEKSVGILRSLRELYILPLS